MKYMIFSEIPVGTIFELSGLKFRKVEHAKRPDDKGYYNALQVGIEEGYALVKEENLFRLVPKKEMEAKKKHKRKRRRRHPPRRPKKE